eukprot:Skav230801  [mRNA]  locus=scaffold312:237111:238107:+ [translate_table: standard]
MKIILLIPTTCGTRLTSWPSRRTFQGSKGTSNAQVALDLEFSGLFLDVDDTSKANSACISSIPEFLPLQLGICCAKCHDGDDGDGSAWELSAHEFNLWPSSKRLFVSDFKSLQFLREHGASLSGVAKLGEYSCEDSQLDA